MDFMNMMGKMQEMQQKIKEAQENLVHLTADGEAAAGMVKATVNGKRQVVKIEIDEDLVKPEDRVMIQDLIVAAVNNALTKIEAVIQKEMESQTSQFMPNIPGFDLGSMFGK